MVHRPGDRLGNMQSTGPTAALAQPVRSPEPPGRKRRWKPVSALEFVGCESCRMTRADYEAYPEDGRKIEYYDVEAELAWMAEDGPSLEHEKPGAKLAALLRELAMTRGSPIECRGAASLHLLDAEAGQVGVIHPDQMVFLDPEAAELPNDFRVVGEGAHPDVVLEVDHTTDVRRGKLTRYEEWGFPELWVEVPDTFSAGRRGGLRPGLRIYVLEDGRYTPSAVSRALPGWRAEEIHRALNERAISPETSRALARVGRTLGEREGTGPDDDPLLGPYGRQQRAVGFVEMVREVLEVRGVAVSAAFAGRLTPHLEDLGPEPRKAITAAACAAASESDFFARLGKLRA